MQWTITKDLKVGCREAVYQANQYLGGNRGDPDTVPAALCHSYKREQKGHSALFLDCKLLGAGSHLSVSYFVKHLAVPTTRYI